jgi:uncharacterized protein YndB with AHSA1/START domain
MTQNLTTDDEGRCTLRMRRALAHPPAAVWAALVEPGRLGEWFPATVALEPRVGGTIEFGFGAPGTVTEFDDGRVIAYTWDTDHLRWEVVPDGEGSVLLLEHSFDDRAGAASFAAGWHTCIAHLGNALAGRPGEDPGIDADEVHERYVTELGLDTASVSRVADGWRVHFERQLTRPATAVWPELDWPGAGAVLASDEPKALEREVDGGTVRFDLGEGTGQGARLVITWTGADESARDAAAAEAPARARVLAR